MPITYRVDAHRHLILTKATGTLTDHDIIDHKKRLSEDPDVKPGMRQLSDVREVSDLQVTPRGVQRMVAQDAASRSVEQKLAIVASEDVVYGMARMYETFSESNTSPSVAVFRDYAAAEKWLGVATDTGS